MFAKKLATAFAAAAVLTAAVPAFAGNQEVSHRTEATAPHVFAPQAQNTWGASGMKVVDIRIERTDPSVFGAYRPQSWEETGDYNADKLPYQRG